MFEWIIENLPTIIVSVFILLAVTVAVFAMIKNRKKGSCGCSCSGCQMAEHCKKNIKKPSDCDK